MTDRQGGYPTPIAAKPTGVSVATLDNWDRRGFLKVSIHPAGGHGVWRVYSFRDLIAIRVARELKQEGIRFRRCARSSRTSLRARASRAPTPRVDEPRHGWP